MSAEAKKITRVDLFEHPQGVMVNKFEEGWTASSQPVNLHINKEQTLDQMVAWLQENGWRVIQWPGAGPGNRGARAWLGKPLPVRTRWGIQYVREVYTRRRRELLKADPRPLMNIDFALEY
jgi:hypothetical protein